MSTADEIVEKAVAAPADTLFKPNPHVVLLVVGAVVKICEDNPNHNEDDALLMVAASVVNKLVTDVKQINDLASITFTYYLEAYRVLGISKLDNDSEDTAVLNTDHKLTLYTKAALSLFDVYIRMPDYLIARRMIGLAAESLYQVATAHQSTTEENPIMEVLSDLSDLAMVSQTASVYVKGKRRKRNYAYIAVLKNILDRATSSHDLSFIRSIPAIHNAVAQVKAGKKTIIIS